MRLSGCCGSASAINFCQRRGTDVHTNPERPHCHNSVLLQRNISASSEAARWTLALGMAWQLSGPGGTFASSAMETARSLFHNPHDIELSALHSRPASHSATLPAVCVHFLTLLTSPLHPSRAPQHIP